MRTQTKFITLFLSLVVTLIFVGFSLPEFAHAEEANQSFDIAESDGSAVSPDFTDSLVEGAGYSLENDSQTVDLRLDALPVGLPVSIGNQTFFTSDDLTVKYTTNGQEVKEDIVLDQDHVPDTRSECRSARAPESTKPSVL